MMNAKMNGDDGHFDLSSYHISYDTGFMLQRPLSRLPEYFEEWNYLASNLPSLIAEKKVREVVDNMPILNTGFLIGHRQLRLAHLQLSFITAGYVWQEGDKGVPKCLPESLAIPFCEVSRLLGVQPILGHVDLALANWALIDPHGGYKFSNLRCLYQLPGGWPGQWFCIITFMMEFTFATCLRSVIRIVNLLQGTDPDDTDIATKITVSLKDIADVTREMKEVLARMHDHLEGKTFFNLLRPFLGGWGGEANALPDGLIYTGVWDEPKKMPGGSAAQSSTLQVLDALLGVEHKQEKREFLDFMRKFMPPDHRQFIEDLEQNPHQLRPYVLRSEDVDLLSAYNDCISALVDLRTYHIQIVTKYIVTASRDENEGNYASLDTKGTGGTSLIPFLKVIRTDTKEKYLTANTLTKPGKAKSGIGRVKLLLAVTAVAALTSGAVFEYMRRT